MHNVLRSVGECCEMVREFFVRVLCSSRFIFVFRRNCNFMQIIQTCSVVLEVEVLFISVTIAVSVLCYNCSLCYKVQFPKLLYTSFMVSGCVVGWLRKVDEPRAP